MIFFVVGLVDVAAECRTTSNPLATITVSTSLTEIKFEPFYVLMRCFGIGTRNLEHGTAQRAQLSPWHETRVENFTVSPPRVRTV